MTVDYTIGNEVMIEDGTEYLISMKEDFDVCNPKLTNLPRESIRQMTGYASYFAQFLLPMLFQHEYEIIPLSYVIEEIRALNDDDYATVFLPKLREKISQPYSAEDKLYWPGIFVDKTPEEVEKIMEEMSSDVSYLALHKDRVHWFKYWAEKCIELHGEDAKIRVDS
ncbi:MAG: hypothetical protein KAS32_26485 [Candidatus Peribacteraceae bacterium]|nr:hypothetical protein [Candidatus Peribacteraceae bacterium]